MHFARSQFGAAAQDRLQEVLFRQYFNEGKNLGELEALLNAAQEADLPVDRARSYLASTEDSDIVRAAIRKSHESCDGVPFFVFPSGAYVSGGESTSTFSRILQKESAILSKK